MTFTKEKLIDHLYERMEFRRGLLEAQAIESDLCEYLRKEIATDEIALAALTAGMEQDPVAEISQAQEYDLEGNLRHQRDIDYYQDDIESLPVGTKLYAAPQLPQPAVLSVPDEIPRLKDGSGFKHVKDGVRYSLNYANGWNACRAAMLQGAEPVTDNTNQQFESLSRGDK